MKNNSEKSNSMLIHLSALSNLVIPFGGILLPLILWQTTKKDSEFTDHHGKEAVNFNLSFFIYNIVCVLVLLASIFGTIFNTVQFEQAENPAELLHILFSASGFFIAIVILIVLGIIKLVLLIIAAVKANEGELYKYPIIIRFIK